MRIKLIDHLNTKIYMKRTNQQNNVSFVEAVVKEWLERAYNFFLGFLLYWGLISGLIDVFRAEP